MDNKVFEGWAIVELMGHRRLAGYVQQAEMFGTVLLRIDVPSGCSAETDNWCPLCGDCKCPAAELDRNDPGCPLHAPASKHGDPAATQFYGGSSIYCLTPTTEETARAFAARNQPAPVQTWELRSLEHREDRDDDEEDDRPF